MVKIKSQRGKIRVFLYAVSVVLILLTALVISQCRVKRLSREINASSQRSLAQLDSCISSINANLTKGLYVNTSPMLESMANELLRDASAAKNALSALDVTDIRLDNTYKFLSQVGSFVYSLEKKLASGGKITDGERAQIRSLIKVSQSLSDSISSVIEQVESGKISLSSRAADISGKSVKSMGISTQLSNAEQAINEYPTLIYDGPFSDNLIEKESELLKNAPEISRDEALKIAAEFCSLDEKSLTFEGKMQGTIPAYVFRSGNENIAVSERGGYAVYMLGFADVGDARYSAAQAVETAKKFLEDNGFLYMEDSYYSITDGVCTVNFAGTEYGITCYTDLIKVGVRLDTGKIVSYDASGFLINHVNREYAEPKLSVEDAEQSVSPLLRVISSKRAIIPTDYETEQDTYEFHCISDSGQEFLVYIDSETGEEDNILILLYADNGILTK